MEVSKVLPAHGAQRLMLCYGASQNGRSGESAYVYVGEMGEGGVEGRIVNSPPPFLLQQIIHAMIKSFRQKELGW